MKRKKKKEEKWLGERKKRIYEKLERKRKENQVSENRIRKKC